AVLYRETPRTKYSAAGGSCQLPPCSPAVTFLSFTASRARPAWLRLLLLPPWFWKYVSALATVSA
ncbi:MAG: hypothetical protein WAM65_07115, partial [Candidatus Korobacteraceae bacterium]